MASESKTVYQPKMPVRPGMTHGYQSAHGIKIVTVESEAKPKAKAPDAPRRK